MSNNGLSEFGSAARHYRVDKGLTLKEMADNLGVSASYLSDVERGNRAFPTRWLHWARFPKSLREVMVPKEIERLQAEIRTLEELLS